MPSPYLAKLGMLTLPSHIASTACKRLCVRVTGDAMLVPFAAMLSEQCIHLSAITSRASRDVIVIVFVALLYNQGIFSVITACCAR